MGQQRLTNNKKMKEVLVVFGYCQNCGKKVREHKLFKVCLECLRKIKEIGENENE